MCGDLTNIRYKPHTLYLFSYQEILGVYWGSSLEHPLSSTKNQFLSDEVVKHGSEQRCRNDNNGLVPMYLEVFERWHY